MPIPTLRDYQVLRRMERWQRNLSGRGVSNSPGGAVVASPASTRLVRARSTPTAQQFIYISISSSTATAATDTNGNPVQWTYTASQVHKTSAGYGGWAALTDGWSGDAFNFMEDDNDGTGTQGNGVDHDGADYPAGFKMQPVQLGTVLPASIVSFTVNDAVINEAWFWPVPNGEDGTCA